MATEAAGGGAPPEAQPARENEVRRFMTPPRSHILAATATGDLRMLHPGSRLAATENLRDGLKRERLDFKPLAGLTRESRASHYPGLRDLDPRLTNEQKEALFVEEKKNWQEGTQKWMDWAAKNRDSFIDTMTALGITDMSTAAQTFYEKFLDSARGTAFADVTEEISKENLRMGLEEFTTTLLAASRSGDIQQVTRRLAAISPMLRTFGIVLGANERVEDYVIAALLTQTDQQAVAEEVPNHLEVPDDTTKESLIALARHAGVTEARTAPVAPEPPAPIEPDQPPTGKEEGEFADEHAVHFAATVNTEKDEDAPPLTRSYVSESGVIVSIASVADGLGGAGLRRRQVDATTQRTEAFLGSRIAQEVVTQSIEPNAEVFATGSIGEIKRVLEAGLAQRLSGEGLDALRERYPLLGTATGRILKEFPTTLSTAVIREEGDKKRVMLFWQGDSPLMVLTPERAYTTMTPGAGDMPMGDDIVHAGGQSLNVHELLFPKDTPVIVLAATDGLLKLGGPAGEEVKTAFNFVFDALDHEEVEKIEDIEGRLQQMYQERSAAGTLGEKDDTTLAVISSIPSLATTESSHFRGGLENVTICYPQGPGESPVLESPVVPLPDTLPDGDKPLDTSPLTPEELEDGLEYLSYKGYKDVQPFDADRQKRFFEDSERARMYVRELREMFGEYGRDTVIKRAEEQAERLQADIENLGIVDDTEAYDRYARPWNFARNRTWYLWHAAKERFLFNHPAIQESMQNTERPYDPFDPLSKADPTKAQEAEKGIYDTMLGWVLYESTRGGGRLYSLPLEAGIPDAERDRLNELLDEEREGKPSLSSYKLREIGELVSKYKEN